MTTALSRFAHCVPRPHANGTAENSYVSSPYQPLRRHTRNGTHDNFSVSGRATWISVRSPTLHPTNDTDDNYFLSTH